MNQHEEKEMNLKKLVEKKGVNVDSDTTFHLLTQPLDVDKARIS